MMRAVVCETPGHLRIAERAPPVRGPGEVLIRIRRVGICGTDYHIMRGTQPYLSYPRVMGHEIAAEVVEAPNAAHLPPGSQVCVIPYLSCGMCRACRRGRENCCSNLEVLGVHRDGALADYLSLPAHLLIAVADLTPEQTAMLEFLAVGHHAVARGGIEAGDRVLVTGAGPIGMAVTVFAARRGAEVTVVDGNGMRTAFCRDRLGARHIFPPDATFEAGMAAITEQEGFDCVFDATGSPAAMEAGFARVAHGGRYVLVSVVTSEISFADPVFHKREMTLLGSRNATRADFMAVISAIRAGEVPTDAMHTHSASLDELPDRFVDWMAPEAGVIKAIVTV